MDFLTGLMIGAILGVGAAVLMGPAVQLWFGRREWAEASKELELTDRLLDRLEQYPAPPHADEDEDEAALGHGPAHRPQAPRRPVTT